MKIKKTYCYCIACGKILDITDVIDSQADCDSCGYSTEFTDQRLTWWNEGEDQPEFKSYDWWDVNYYKQ